MRRIGYARVSSTQQGRQDLSTQRSMLADAGVKDVRVERGSGARSDRPVMNEVVAEATAAAQAGEDVEVVVVRLDRWGRSLPDVVASLTRLQDAGVRFRSLTEAGVALDGSPSSMLVLTVLAAAASYERQLLLMRVAEAKAAKGPAARGGRPRSLTPAMVQRALTYVEVEGMSMAQAAARIGVSKRTLNRYLADARAVAVTA